MKDKLNIEKLFKEKFDGFEGDVSPKLWNTIQQNVAASAVKTAVVKTGMSLVLKSMIVGVSVLAVGATAIYFSQPGNEKTSENNQKIVQERIQEAQNQDKTQLNQEKEEHIINPVAVNIPEPRKEEEKIVNESTAKLETPINTVNEIVKSDKLPTEKVINESKGDEKEASLTTNEVVKDQQGNSENKNLKEEERVVVTPSGSMSISSNALNVLSTVNFTANATNATSIRWNFGDNTIGEGENVAHVFSQAGDYTVTLTVLGENDLNYLETQIVKITSKSSIDNIPNVFTPDGDRINDLFSVKTTEIKHFLIEIRDLKGKKVYETNDVNFSWDGTDFGGNIVSEGIYTYIIKAEGNNGSFFTIPGELNVR